ncbi:DUF2637 domain-containing protein [Dactylosporangium siamense]|uniref:DUF2637 domain-containing protein n=1 Tax=Dactylosporangium siamense TaxID=685454 RepID=A0A919UF48_9ACTN|nr:DUF2637 domain-containing protein [Dactylosporangium siamense]GIG53124.1 hypothetical protein Dsi01nite_111650 [Dactylosporangium siamense]
MTPASNDAGRTVDPVPDDAQLRRLRLMQWTLRGTLGLALAVSMAANVLHAAPDPVARSIAAWSPLALYAAIEVMTRVPIRNRLLGGIRIVATVAIAVIAGVTSYLHMVGVAERYGESWQVVYLLPISVDGLVAVLTLSLLDIASQVRTISAGLPVARQHLEGGAAGTPSATLAAFAIPMPALASSPASDGATASRTTTTQLDEPTRRRRAGGRRPASRPTSAAPSQAKTTASPDDAEPLPAELRHLLEPAASAYADLRAAGTPITRDAFAAALRDRGLPLRSAKITPLLTAVRDRCE